MIKSRLRFLNIFLAVSIFLNMSPMRIMSMTASTKFRDIKNNKRKIIETSKEIKKNKSDQKKCEQLKKQLSNQIMDVVKNIDSIEEKIASIKKQADSKQAEINLHTQEVNQNVQKINELSKKADEIKNKLSVVKNSALNAAKIGYCDYKSNNYIAKIFESADIGSFIRLSEYLEKTSAIIFENIYEFSETFKQLSATTKEVEEIKKKNEELKKLAQNKQDELRQQQKDLSILNEKERQNLSALNAGLVNADKKTKEMRLAVERLENSRKKYQDTVDSLQAAIEEQKRKFPNGIPPTPPNAASENKQPFADKKAPSNATRQVENGKMCFPVPSGRISSGFGPRGKRFHHGIDICAKKRTPIYAAKSGHIKFIGSTKYGGGYGGYGKCIEINHGSGQSTLYGHMDGFVSGLSIGSFVRKGQVIGYVGNTGDAGVDHLHWEVIENKKKVNPKGYY